MTAGVIMHNMIVEDESFGVLHGLDSKKVGDPIQLPEQNPTTFEDFLQMHHQIRNQGTHVKLENDLVEHLCGFCMDN